MWGRKFWFHPGSANLLSVAMNQEGNKKHSTQAIWESNYMYCHQDIYKRQNKNITVYGGNSNLHFLEIVINVPLELL